jgi:hypothetical protein
MQPVLLILLQNYEISTMRKNFLFQGFLMYLIILYLHSCSFSDSSPPKGGRLIFRMRPEPNKEWGKDGPPPSMSDLYQRYSLTSEAPSGAKEFTTGHRPVQESTTLFQAPAGAK